MTRRPISMAAARPEDPHDNAGICWKSVFQSCVSVPNIRHSHNLTARLRTFSSRSALAGENLVAIAACRPDAAFIGAEPFINGVASLVRHIEERHLTNIRIWDDDVRLILGGLESGVACRGLCSVSRPLAETQACGAADLAPDVLDELARLIRPSGASFWQATIRLPKAGC